MRRGGAISTGAMVRPEPSPNFTDREDLLEAIANLLERGDAQMRRVALHGLGGIGKTELAGRYLELHRGEYQVMCWIDAEIPSSVAQQYTALASRLGLPGHDHADVDRVCESVKDWLDTHDRWILVFDNVEDPRHLDSFLPSADRGHVLITSRRPDWRGYAEPIQVDELPAPDSVRLLCASGAGQHEAAAVELAEALGYLPLALQHAGAYIRSTGTSCAAYLALMRAHGLDEEVAHAGAIRGAWALAFDAVRRASGSASALLNLLAFLAPNDIDRSLLTEATLVLHPDRPVVPEALTTTLGDPVLVNDAFRILRRFSLVRPDSTPDRDVIRVHPLVQEATRDRLGPEQRREWCSAALALVLDGFPREIEKRAVWDRCGRLLPHAIAVIEHADRLHLALPSATELAIRVGQYLQQRASFSEAAHYLRLGWRFAEVTEPHGSSLRVRLLNQLGLVLHRLREFAEAAASLDRALEENTSADAQGTVARIRSLNLLAMVAREQDLQQAVRHLNEALAVGEEAFGPSDSELVSTLNGLGWLKLDLEDFTGAERSFRRALDCGGQLADGHPWTASTMLGLSRALAGQGSFDRAERLADQSREIFERAFGAEDPNVAAALLARCNARLGLGSLEEAEADARRALEIDARVYTAEHPEVAADLEGLGKALARRGGRAEARDVFARAQHIYAEEYGPEDRRTLAIRAQLDALT
jgi:tetratricopeptide (TPR) repeat protein